MTVTRGYRTTVSDMWQGEDASNLDAVASSAFLWGIGSTRGIHRPLHVLRFRFLEILTKAKLHAQNPTKHPDKTCDLCTQTGNWFHIWRLNVPTARQVLHSYAQRSREGTHQGNQKWETREVVDNYQLWQDGWAR